MLAELKRKSRQSKRIFALSIRSIRQNFRKTRSKTAYKEQNERINRITFHTFRHWYATMLYHKTKDIVLVQRKLGYKSIKNTLKYVQLADELFRGEAEYTCRTAENPKHAI